MFLVGLKISLILTSTKIILMCAQARITRPFLVARRVLVMAMLFRWLWRVILLAVFCFENAKFVEFRLKSCSRLLSDRVCSVMCQLPRRLFYEYRQDDLLNLSTLCAYSFCLFKFPAVKYESIWRVLFWRFSYRLPLIDLARARTLSHTHTHSLSLSLHTQNTHIHCCTSKTQFRAEETHNQAWTLMFTVIELILPPTIKTNVTSEQKRSSGKQYDSEKDSPTCARIHSKLGSTRKRRQYNLKASRDKGKNSETSSLCTPNKPLHVSALC